MTVSSQTSNETFDGNGVTTIFDLPFRFFENSDIQASLVNPATNTVTALILGTDYSLTGAGLPEQFGTAPGKITTFVPVAVGMQLHVERIMDIEQLTDIINQGEFFAEVHEDVFDRLCMLIQQGFSGLARALLKPIGKDFYDAGGSRIANLGNPIEDQDAIPKLYNEQYIAGLLAQFTGPLNNANNVMYIYPNGVARSVQTLADKTDPALGAAGIGFNGGTVRDELLDLRSDLNAEIADTQNKFLDIFASPLQASTIPMHFGVLRGRGWTAGDPPWNAGDPENVKSTTSTAAVGVTSTDIPVSSSTNFTAGMLICYLATDGEYYSAKLHAVLAGPIFRLGETLPAEIANGAPIYNFYRDDAHPNTIGGATIVDYALRLLQNDYRARQIEIRARDGAIWEPILAATITQIGTTSYSVPGAGVDGERGISVFSNTPNAGAQTRYFSVTGGDYLLSIPVNPGLRTGGFSGFVEVFVDEFTTEGAQQTIASSGSITGYDSIRLLEISLTARPGSMLRIRTFSANAGGFTYYVGAFNLYRLASKLNDVNRGKHVLFGDSWFSPGGAMDVRFQARLNKATVVNKGVPGNRATELINRFATDVVPENPDYVWVMVGTNDYYSPISPELFEQQVNQLRRMIQDIGAQAIFFDASVGAITFVPEKLTASREYRMRVRYEDVATPPDGVGTVLRSANFHGQGLSINAGASVIVGVCPGLTRYQASLRFALMNQTSINVLVGYATTADGASTVDTTTFSGSAVHRDKPAPRTTDTAPRAAVVRLSNPTGGVVVVSYTIDMAWNQQT